MKHPSRIAAILLAASLAARAEDAPAPKVVPAGTTSTSVAVHVQADTGSFLADLALNMMQFGLAVAILDHEASRRSEPADDSFGKPLERRENDMGPSYRPPRERERDARSGLLFSFGLGGGSFRYSGFGAPYTRTGALDLDFRLGYGFSDRFQLFGDIGVDSANVAGYGDVSSWTLTMRGQTVLIGDRQGNGLNLNAGVGVGGLSFSDGCCQSYHSQSGLALVGGLSYDARVGRQFSVSPELFYVWHQVPNPGFAADVASTFGLRLNLLWYLH